MYWVTKRALPAARQKDNGQRLQIFRTNIVILDQKLGNNFMKVPYNYFDVS